MTIRKTFPLETDFFPEYVIDEMLNHFPASELINIIALCWVERGKLAAGVPLTSDAVEMCKVLMQVVRAK